MPPRGLGPQRRMRYEVVGERRMPCGSLLRVVLLSEHKNPQTGEIFFVAGPQSKQVLLRVEVKPRVGLRASAPPKTYIAELLDSNGAAMQTYTLQQQSQRRDVVPLQTWKGQDDFTGGPVTATLSEVAGEWRSANVECRIVPLAKRLGYSSLSILVRALDASVPPADWSVRLDGIVTASRHDWGGVRGCRVLKRGPEDVDEGPPGKERRIGEAGADAGALAVLPAADAELPIAIPLVCFTFTGITRTILPAGKAPALLQLFVTQNPLGAPLLGVCISASLTPSPANPNDSSIVIPSTSIFAEPVKDGAWVQSFEVARPPGLFSLLVAANGALAPITVDEASRQERYEQRVAFCSVKIESPSAGADDIPGRTVNLQIAVDGLEAARAVGGFLRVFLSDGRVLDRPLEAAAGLPSPSSAPASTGPRWSAVHWDSACAVALENGAAFVTTALDRTLLEEMGVASQPCEGVPPPCAPAICSPRADFVLAEGLAPELAAGPAPSRGASLRRAASRAASRAALDVGQELVHAATVGDADLIDLLFDDALAAPLEPALLERAATAAAEGHHPLALKSLLERGASRAGALEAWPAFFEPLIPDELPRALSRSASRPLAAQN
eukprot:tig00021582_g22618.t1